MQFQLRKPMVSFILLRDIRNMLKYAFELQTLSWGYGVGSLLLDLFIKSVGQELQINI